MRRAGWWVGAVVRFVLVPMLGVAALTWWVVGQQSTGSDSIARISLLQDHPRAVPVLGAVLLLVSAVDLAATRPMPPGRYCASVLPPVLLGGVGTGIAGRVITARVHGANIGGGLAILFWPFPLAGMIAWAVVMLAIGHRRATPADRVADGVGGQATVR